MRSLSGVWRQVCVRPTLRLVVKVVARLVVSSKARDVWRQACAANSRALIAPH